MQDNLKKYIDQNREELELYTLQKESAWENIADSLEGERPTRSKPRWMWTGLVASLLLVTATVSFYLGKTQESLMSAEWQDTEMYYQQQIEWKMNLVKNQIGDEDILADLEQMDETFRDLKSDLKEDVNNEEVIRAMVESYQLKLKILERILNELDHEGKSIDHSDITL